MKPRPATKPRSPSNPTQSPWTPGRRLTPFFISGLVLLEIAIACAMLLSMESIWALALPGCGGDSPCAKASQSIWGKVPGTTWPVSFVGLAFWLAMLHGWIAAWVAGSPPAWLRWASRLGVVASIYFLVITFTQNLPCPYCRVAHAANILFAVILETTAILAKSPPPPLRSRAMLSFTAALATFAVVTLSAGLLRSVAKSDRDAAAERERAASEKALQEKTARDRAAAANPNTNSSQPSTAKPFTGRYRKGPDPAPIRVVIFSDFECPDCKIIDSQVRSILQTRTDVAVSHKHFPLCPECNRFAPNLHPNACKAARAAEAAGVVGGSAAFWKMHEWLFDRGGKFNDSDLQTAAASFGLDWTRFLAAMNDPSTAAAIAADIDEGMSLGMMRTPMVFINGVEMKGWAAGQAVSTTVENLARSNPPALTAAADRPPTAAQRYVADWRDNPLTMLPPRTRSFALGPADAVVRITIFGDYFVSQSLDAENAVRALMARNPDIRFEYRYFPFDQSCNPSVGQSRFPLACRAAAAAEAAGILGGAPAYWKMHAWLQKNSNRLSDTTLREGAASAGIDPTALLNTMTESAVTAAIQADVQAAKIAGVNGIPTLLINDRTMPRWQLEGADVLGDAVNEARAAASAPK